MHTLLHKMWQRHSVAFDFWMRSQLSASMQRLFWLQTWRCFFFLSLFIKSRLKFIVITCDGAASQTCKLDDYDRLYRACVIKTFVTLCFCRTFKSGHAVRHSKLTLTSRTSNSSMNIKPQNNKDKARAMQKIGSIFNLQLHIKLYPHKHIFISKCCF